MPRMILFLSIRGVGRKRLRGALPARGGGIVWMLRIVGRGARTTLGDRIKAMPAPRMASAEPLDRQPQSLQDAVVLHRLNGISRAGRVEAAPAARGHEVQDRRDDPLIEPKQNQGEGTHRERIRKDRPSLQKPRQGHPRGAPGKHGAGRPARSGPHPLTGGGDPDRPGRLHGAAASPGCG